VAVLDVGGDAVARGDEPGLRSPLADALGLAAAIELDLDVDVIIAGPGLDAELTEEEVLAVTGDEPAGRIGREDVEPFRATFDWHPSEATALLAAAARGVRGRVEIRDSGLSVALTDRSSATFRLALADVTAINRLAPALARTSSLDEAGEIAREVSGFSEIDYERTKADRIDAMAPPSAPTDVVDLLRTFEREAAARGVDFVTFRRIAEATGTSLADSASLRRYLIATKPNEHDWPLWSIVPKALTAIH
jgi:hypothetical protein